MDNLLIICYLLSVYMNYMFSVFFTVEISPNTFEYQPGPGVPVKKIVMPTGQHNNVCNAIKFNSNY